jgi:hypothetical protein
LNYSRKKATLLDPLESLPKASRCFWEGTDEILRAVSEDLFGGKRKQKLRRWEHDPIALLETKGDAKATWKNRGSYLKQN